MQRPVIISGARTPIGRFGGAFKSFSASDLGAVAIKAALERSRVSPKIVDEVIIGNVLQAAEAGYAPRLASLKAGIPQEVPVIAINRQCASGLDAINIASDAIRAGRSEVIVAGGIENMSLAPYVVRNIRWSGLRMGKQQMDDSLVEGLSCPVNYYHMGITAENIATRYNVSRSDQDKLALLSHQRASLALEQGLFANQISPVKLEDENGEAFLVERDEGPRADTTIQQLAELQPIFKENGTVTAGNASSINDGAAAVIVMSEQKARQLGVVPQLECVSSAVVGVDPAYMGTGPIPAVHKALERGGLSIKDIDLFEINEAFAAQTIHCINELELDLSKTNVNGSGISLGHPIGATGAIMTVKLMDLLSTRNGEHGIVTMCVGGGQGCATVFRRLS